MQAPPERLPWLNDEPPRGPVTAAQRAPGVGMWPWYLLLLLLVAGVAVGAWWLATGKQAAPPVLPVEQSIPIPINRPAPSAEPEPIAVDEPQAAEVAEPMALSPRPSAPVTGEGSFTGSTERRRVEQAVERVREPVRAPRGIFPAEDPAAVDAAPQAGPMPIILYHPQPNRGRVVQLGAFPTKTQAEDSWRKITRRYPYLATKPRMVNTVDVRALGGGRPTRMYRLQFGTSSQAQSVVICQQLERAGHSCVVVY